MKAKDAKEKKPTKDQKAKLFGILFGGTYENQKSRTSGKYHKNMPKKIKGVSAPPKISPPAKED